MILTIIYLLRLPVIDKFKDMGTVVMGKVESGSVRGDNLLVMPNKAQVKVIAVYCDEDKVRCAGPGENLRVRLSGIEEEDIVSGFVLCNIVRHLEENLDDWLTEELDNYLDDDYLDFDCPGQQFRIWNKFPCLIIQYTYSCDGQTFNFLIDNGFVFLVVADESVGRSVPFVYLERLKDDFKQRYGASIRTDGPHSIGDEDDEDDDLFEDQFSIAYNLDREFGPRIKEHMQYCMNHPDEISKLSKLNAQISEVKRDNDGQY